MRIEELKVAMEAAVTETQQKMDSAKKAAAYLQECLDTVKPGLMLVSQQLFENCFGIPLLSTDDKSLILLADGRLCEVPKYEPSIEKVRVITVEYLAEEFGANRFVITLQNALKNIAEHQKSIKDSNYSALYEAGRSV